MMSEARWETEPVADERWEGGSAQPEFPEHAEQPESMPERDRPRRIDGLDQPRPIDVPQVSGPPEHLQLRIHNHREFAELRREAIERGDYEPGSARVEAARPPWCDRPECPEPQRYTDVPSAQRRIEEQFARDGLTNETLRLVNPVDQYNNDRSENCAENARAVASLLDGQPYAARPMTRGANCEPGERVGQMEDWAGSHEFGMNLHCSRPEDNGEVGATDAGEDVSRGFRQLEEQLRIQGPGAHALVFVEWRPDDGAEPGDGSVGHWFNIADIDGRIVYIDAQARGDDVVCADAASENAAYYRREASAMSWVTGRG